MWLVDEEDGLTGSAYGVVLRPHQLPWGSCRRKCRPHQPFNPSRASARPHPVPQMLCSGSAPPFGRPHRRASSWWACSSPCAASSWARLLCLGRCLFAGIADLPCDCCFFFVDAASLCAVLSGSSRFFPFFLGRGVPAWQEACCFLCLAPAPGSGLSLDILRGFAGDLAFAPEAGDLEAFFGMGAALLLR
jgi:hypothetical protein